jgi:hypothetical protein
MGYVMVTTRFPLCTSLNYTGTDSARRVAMRAALLISCLLLATACDENSVAGPTVGLNEQFTLAPNEVAVVRDVGVRVQFVEVTGDSRCPADAVCITGGDALVHIRVSDASSASTYELHTGDVSRASIVHGSVKIALVELQPYPFSSRTIAPGDYRATLRTSRP